MQNPAACQLGGVGSFHAIRLAVGIFGILATQKFQLAKVDQQIQVSRSRSRVSLAAQQLSSSAPGRAAACHLVNGQLIAWSACAALSVWLVIKQTRKTPARVSVSGWWVDGACGLACQHGQQHQEKHQQDQQDLNSGFTVHRRLARLDVASPVRFSRVW